MSSDVTPSADTPNASTRSRTRRGMHPGVATLVCLAVLLALACLIALLLRGGGGDDGATDTIRENRFQAIHLTDDRVYFGRVRDVGPSWLTVEDAFFLRRAPAKDAKEPDAAGSIEVVRVQQEVGGDGDLLVNSREVTRIQNLTANSDVSRTIEDALKD